LWIPNGVLCANATPKFVVLFLIAELFNQGEGVGETAEKEPDEEDEEGIVRHHRRNRRRRRRALLLFYYYLLAVSVVMVTILGVLKITPSYSVFSLFP